MRKIQKAKLVNGCLEVEYTETQHESGNKVSDTIKFSGGHKVHADLLATFDALTPHLMTLCEWCEFRDAEEHQDKHRFSVTGFSIGGSDEHEGVTLIGRKNLKSKKVLNLVTPFVKFDDETTDYDYAHELWGQVSAACREVEAYLDGKHEPTKQMTLELQ